MWWMGSTSELCILKHCAPLRFRPTIVCACAAKTRSFFPATPPMARAMTGPSVDTRCLNTDWGSPFLISKHST